MDELFRWKGGESTDFLIKDGKIVHNITYEHSTKPNNIISDTWKLGLLRVVGLRHK